MDTQLLIVWKSKIILFSIFLYEWICICMNPAVVKCSKFTPKSFKDIWITKSWVSDQKSFLHLGVCLIIIVKIIQRILQAQSMRNNKFGRIDFPIPLETLPTQLENLSWSEFRFLTWGIPPKEWNRSAFSVRSVLVVH